MIINYLKCWKSSNIREQRQQIKILFRKKLRAEKNHGILSKNRKIKINRKIILPVVLYECEIWSLTLRKERRLMVFENRLLRRIFRPKRDDVKI